LRKGLHPRLSSDGRGAGYLFVRDVWVVRGVEPGGKPVASGKEQRLVFECRLAFRLDAAHLAIARGEHATALRANVDAAPFTWPRRAGVVDTNATTWNQQIELVVHDIATNVDGLDDQGFPLERT